MEKTAKRLVRYGGAMSLDGFIAGPNGEYDWIVMDPELDFGALMAQFDTYLIGRKTFDAMNRMGNTSKSTPGIKNIVFSRTLKPSDHPKRLQGSGLPLRPAHRPKPGHDH